MRKLESVFLVVLVGAMVFVLVAMFSNSTNVASATSSTTYTVGSNKNQGDTWAQSTNATTPNGAQPTIMAGYNSADGAYFRGYIRFNLAGTLPSIGAQLISAKLYLYASSGTPWLALYKLDNKNWNENVLTWNNQVNSWGAKLDNIHITASGWFAFDVTSAVQDAITSDNLLSLGLGENASTYAMFDSKEGTNTPYLSLEYGASYTIRLYWEDNNQPATTENATLWAAMSSYGSRENSIVNGVCENVVYLERPYYIKVVYGGYYHARIPSADNGTIYFYITKDNKLTGYSFALVDLTGMFGPPNGTMKISKMYGENLMVINEDYWAADSTIATYLVQTNRYQLSVKSGTTGGVRDLDGYTMGITSPITIQVGAGGEYPNLQEIYNNIYWATYRDTDNTTIRAIFQDNTGNCLTASVTIYDENGTFVSLMEPDNGNFIATHLDAHPDSGYTVVLYETRNDENLPSITFSTPISAVFVTVVPPPTTGVGFGNPVPLAAIGSFVILGAVGMAFDFIRPHIASLGIAITAAFLFGLGWLPVNLYTIALVFILAILFGLGWRRYG